MKPIKHLVLLITYFGILFSSEALDAQGMREIYAIDFLTYEEKGSDPLSVASYWNGKGHTAIDKLVAGEKPNLPDREKILAELIKLHTHARDAKDVQMLILRRMREAQAIKEKKPEAIENEIRRAEKTFELIGAEWGREIAMQSLKTRLPEFFGRRANDPVVLRRFLSYDSLRQEIELTKGQQEEIDRIIADAKKQYKTESEEVVAKIRIQTDKQWGDFLKRLDDTQREKIASIAGQPLGWYEGFDWPDRWNRRSYHRIGPWQRRGDRVFYGTEIDYEIDDTGRLPHERSDEEIAKMGLLKVDRFLVELLNNPFVRRYLNLDLEQQEGLRILVNRYQKKGILFYAPGRRKELESSTVELYPAEITSLFNDEQIKELRWLEYQARTGGKVFSLAFALLPAEVAQGLYPEFDINLPDEIRELFSSSRGIRQIDIRRGLERSVLNFRKNPGVDMKSVFELGQIKDPIEMSLDGKIRKVLTPTQIESYQQLVSGAKRQKVKDH